MLSSPVITLKPLTGSSKPQDARRLLDDREYLVAGNLVEGRVLASFAEDPFQHSIGAHPEDSLIILMNDRHQRGTQAVGIACLVCELFK